MPHRILVVEDEPEMLTMLHDNLAFEQYDVMCADTGEAGLELAAREPPHLVLLDVMLPRISGYEVCQRLRAGGFTAPIIMLTARNTEIDRVTGLDLGANDYVGKPFSVRELTARVRAQLRLFQPAPTELGRVMCGDVLIDFKGRTVAHNATRTGLSPHEHALMEYLVRHPGEIVTRQELLTHVWGYSGEATTRTVDNFVAKLRRKIEIDPDNPQLILTVHGVGYQFVPGPTR